MSAALGIACPARPSVASASATSFPACPLWPRTLRSIESAERTLNAERLQRDSGVQASCGTRKLTPMTHESSDSATELPRYHEYLEHVGIPHVCKMFGTAPSRDEIYLHPIYGRRLAVSHVCVVMHRCERFRRNGAVAEASVPSRAQRRTARPPRSGKTAAVGAAAIGRGDFPCG